MQTRLFFSQIVRGTAGVEGIVSFLMLHWKLGAYKWKRPPADSAALWGNINTIPQ
jgi:hypothetical protein